MFSSIRNGLQTAWRQPRLVILLWAWNLTLGMIVALPMWAWLRGALDLSVEGESFLGRFNIGVLADLTKYADPNPFDLMGAGVRGALLVALVASAFTNGGILEVLGSPDDRRTFMHRFFRGGGHFFWRFVRLSALAGVGAVLVSGIVAAATSAALQPLSDAESGYGPYLAGLVTLAAIAVFGGLFVLALDYARIRVANDDSRGMFRAYVAALAFVLRHALATYGMAAAILIIVGILLLLYVGHETVWTTSGWGTLLLLVIVQQAVVLARTGLRVALVGAERDYFLAHQPPAAQPVVQPVPPAPAPQDAPPAASEPEPAPPTDSAT